MSDWPEVRFVSAFTTEPIPPRDGAAVVVGHAEATAVRSLAADLGCPVTVHVMPLAPAASKVRFFYPRMESSICVVGLMAAAHLVMARGEVSKHRFETNGPTIAVEREAGGTIMLALPPPVAGDVVDTGPDVALALGVSAFDLGAGPSQIVTAGKPKLLIPFASARALGRARPRMDEVRRLCEPLGAEGALLFAAAGDGYEARHFNPFALDREDPICGVGVAALGTYLALRGIDSRARIAVAMGESTGTPGVIHLDRTGPAPRIGGCTHTIETAHPTACGAGSGV